MVSIGVIAPSRNMYREMSRLAVELGIADSVMIRQGTLQEGLRIAQEMAQEGVGVIVSRGGTMELLLDAGIRTPLVHVPISMQDTSSILRTAQTLTDLPRPKIALVAYARVASDVASFSALLDMDLHIYQSGSTRESIVNALEQALRENADVVVGGITAHDALAGRSVPFIPHESGEASLRQALLEAKLIAYARSLEQVQTERFKAVMDTSADGIFLLEANGDILAANQAARRFLNLAVNPEGRNIADVLPLAQIGECLSTGMPLRNEIVTLPNMVCVATITPFLLQGKVTGAVLSFQPATQIAEMEAKIRRNRSARGMNALYRFESIRGVSAEILGVQKQAARYAASDETVLLQGETGTGKELFAQAMHNASAKRNGPFVAVSCAALPSTLLESEFFGYEEGAFTGANRRGKTGFFELADQGTIFLDEVSGLDSHGQSRLLRVLQERSILRLGSDTHIPVNFRVIAASNVDLWPLVRRGEFRQDLFFRLHVLPLVIPPLRERGGDVRHLARLFLARHSPGGTRFAFAPEAMDALCEYSWPGNVRELEHCIRQICLNVAGSVVSVEHVRRALSFTPQQPVPRSMTDGMRAVAEDAPHSAAGTAPLRDAERTVLLDALRTADGNQRKAAALLGINSSTLYRKMKKLGIGKTRIFQKSVEL
jgi:transcriptional regulator with PAS, ATPase and Fis domain